MPPLFAQTERFTEFPVQMAYSSVVKSQPNILKIESLIGLVVYCRLDVFSCNVTVSGYYHNKTLGEKFNNLVLRHVKYMSKLGFILNLAIHPFMPKNGLKL